MDHQQTSVRHSSPGQFPSPPSYDIPPVVKAKLALTHTPDPNRSTAVNFVHVNGRSLYIIDWLMVAVEDVLQHVKGGELSGRRKCQAGNGSGGYVKGEMYERIPSKHRVNISQYLHTYNKLGVAFLYNRRTHYARTIQHC